MGGARGGAGGGGMGAHGMNGGRSGGGSFGGGGPVSRYAPIYGTYLRFFGPAGPNVRDWLSVSIISHSPVSVRLVGAGRGGPLQGNFADGPVKRRDGAHRVAHHLHPQVDYTGRCAGVGREGPMRTSCAVTQVQA